MILYQFVTVLDVFEDRFRIRWRRWRRRRVVESLRRLVFGVVMRRRHLRGEMVHGQKAVLSQSSDVIRHHISAFSAKAAWAFK